MIIHRHEKQDAGSSPQGQLNLLFTRGNGKMSSSRTYWHLTGCYTVIKSTLVYLVLSASTISFNHAEHEQKVTSDNSAND